METVLQR